jgi:hypothetical protein
MIRVLGSASVAENLVKRKCWRWKVKYWISIFMAAATSFVVAGCIATPVESWTYIGTWANSAYNGCGCWPPAKITLSSTSYDYYTNDYDASPAISGTFAVTSDWTSGGNHFFRGVSGPGSPLYHLLRVSHNNNTLEMNSQPYSYPESIDPAGWEYRIFARQS